MKKSSLKRQIEKNGITNNLYINSNLCPYNSFLWGKCKKLHTEQLSADSGCTMVQYSY